MNVKYRTDRKLPAQLLSRSEHAESLLGHGNGPRAASRQVEVIIAEEGIRLPEA
ncbi:hypothetical protein D3C80_2232080 [compost metagenome]